MDEDELRNLAEACLTGDLLSEADVDHLISLDLKGEASSFWSDAHAHDLVPFAKLIKAVLKDGPQ